MSDPALTPRRAGDGPGHRREFLAICGLAALILYSLLRSLAFASSKPLWFDELCTFIVARLATPHAIWQALKIAADAQPPLFYIIEAHALAAIPHSELALRLPSLIAFAATLLFVFAFVRKRTNAPYALLSSALLLLTVLFDTYAVEARPYSMEVACFALALLCYQRAPSAPWMLLMALSFAVAENLHYYAIFALVPFGAAEIAFSWIARRVRPAVWLALACGCLPVLWLSPLLRALKLTYGHHELAPASLVRAFAIYGWIFATQRNVAIVFALVAIITVALLVAAAKIAAALAKFAHAPDTAGALRLTHEHVLALGFLYLPFIAYAGGKFAHGALLDRYVLSVVLGFPLAACYLHASLGKRGRAILALAVVILLGAQEARFWQHRQSQIAELQSLPARVEQMIASTGRSDLPVAISSPIQFLELDHYAPPDLHRRLVFLSDPAAAIQFDGSDSGDRQLLALHNFAPLRVVEFSNFRTQHREFLLLSNGDARLDWWPARLRADPDVRLDALATQGPSTLYDVKQ